MKTNIKTQIIGIPETLDEMPVNTHFIMATGGDLRLCRVIRGNNNGKYKSIKYVYNPRYEDYLDIYKLRTSKKTNSLYKLNFNWVRPLIVSGNGW